MPGGTAQPRPGSRPLIKAADLGAMALLVALAALLRWPDYLTLPAFTDETLDALRSLAIADGRLQTPVDSSSYIGALHNYLTAGLFRLFGPQIYLPRLLVLVIGCLTPAAVYLLAREWLEQGRPGRARLGRLAGLLAGLMLVTNPAHVLVDSHIGWSNSLTPLFSTLGIWQLSLAVRRRHGPSLCWSSGLLAVALLTHPATLLLLPACGLYLVWKAPGLLRSRWLVPAGALFGLIYSPLVVYNLLGLTDPRDLAERLRANHPFRHTIQQNAFSGVESLDFAEQVRRQHADGRPLGPDVYLDNLDGYVLLLTRSLSGAVDPRDSPFDYLRDPTVLLWALVGLTTPLALARRGNSLPLLLVVSTLAVAPLWSLNRFEPISNARYVLPTVVAIQAAAAAAIVWTSAALAGRWRRAGPLAAGGGALIGLLLVVQPLFELARYYDSRPADNRALIDAAARIEAALGPDEAVLIDRRLNDRRLGDGAVQLDRALEMLLTIRDVAWDDFDAEPAELSPLVDGARSQLVVLDRTNVPRLSERFKLTQLATITPRQNRGDRLRDTLPAWRDSPLAGLLRALDPRGDPERRDGRDCLDCGDPAVFWVAARP